MATPSLRPLGIGEILDAGIKVVVRNWRTLVACTVVPTIPIAVVFVLLIASLDPEALELIPEQSTTPETIDVPGAGVIAAFILTGLAGMVALIVAYGACFNAVTEAWLGGRPDFRSSVRFGLRRLGSLFLLSVVWVVFMLVAWIPCFVPLIFFGVAWCVSAPALLIERVGPFAALRRSYRLIERRWWASLLLVFVCYMLTSVVSFVLQLPLLIVAELAAGENAIVNGLAQMLGYTLSFAITTPYFVAVLVILYFDQRVRKEGFDLQLMADRMGIERDPSAPPPAPAAYGAPAPVPGQWSSPSGWSAPSAEPAQPPLWGSGERPRDDRPAEASPWMTPPPESAPPPGWAPPAWSGPRPAGAEPEDGEDSEPRRDKDRADWQPPEAPRGPGGL